MIEEYTILPNKSFDYVNVGNPLPTVNPDSVGASWLNITTGELFFCKDNTADNNSWVGQLGSIGAEAVSETNCVAHVKFNSLTPVDEKANITSFSSTAAHDLVGGGPVEESAFWFKDSLLSATTSIFDNIADGDFTVSVWLMPVTDSGSWNWMISVPVSAASQDPSFVITTNGNKFRVTLGTWFTEVFDNGLIQPSNTAWHHFLLRRTGTSVETWIDGNYVDATTNGYDLSGLGTTIYFCGLHPITILGQFGIQHYRVYDVAVSDKQIQALWGEGAARIR